MVVDESIAIVGQSCRFPGAETPQEFWDLLSQGSCAIGQIPDSRPGLSRRLMEGHLTRGGFLKSPVQDFDAKFFGISSREAPFMDPQQRILLEVTWEALENAGINPHTLRGSETAIFIGIWSNDYMQILKDSTLAPNCELHDAYLGTVSSAVAARLSFFLGCCGENLSVDAGCAGSLQSVHMACQALLREEAPIAIAGGVNLILGDRIGKADSLVFAPDGICKTFDAAADGFGRAEGCGILILKRHSDAVRDKDTILGLIRGTAVNCDGTSAVYGNPCKTAQAKVIRQALKRAGLEPKDISYLEAHGTGTAIGDPMEMASLNAVFTERKRKGPLVLGSVKTNVGHTEAAAGVAGIIKVILSMKNETIPPHLHLQRPNPECDFRSIPVHFPKESMPWTKVPGEPRRAGVNAFALSGHNAHVILEEAPDPVTCDSRQQRPTHLLTLSAKTQTALDTLRIKYVDLLTKPGLILEDVTYTANTGRAHLTHRLVARGSTLEELKDRLSSGVTETAVTSSVKGKVAFVFSDLWTKFQSSSCQSLYSGHPVFRAAVDECLKVLRDQGIIPIDDVTKLLCPGDEMSTGQNPMLENTLCVFILQYALVRVWESYGVSPSIVLGHGLGELSAGAVSQVISLSDALLLVTHIVQWLEVASGQNPEDCISSSVAIKSSADRLESQLESFMKNNPAETRLYISSYNSPNEVVVTGDESVVKQFSDSCLKNGLKTRKLVGFGPSHLHSSSILEPLLESITDVAENVIGHESRKTFVSTSMGQTLGDTHFLFDTEYWTRNLLDRKPTQLAKGLKSLLSNGARVFVEIGPHPHLLGHLMETMTSVEAQNSTWVPSLRNSDDPWSTLDTSLGKLYLGGLEIHWPGFHAPFSGSKTTLPNYPFEKTPYWAD